MEASPVDRGLSWVGAVDVVARPTNLLVTAPLFMTQYYVYDVDVVIVLLSCASRCCAVYVLCSLHPNAWNKYIDHGGTVPVSRHWHRRHVHLHLYLGERRRFFDIWRCPPFFSSTFFSPLFFAWLCCAVFFFLFVVLCFFLPFFFFLLLLFCWLLVMVMMSRSWSVSTFLFFIILSRVWRRSMHLHSPITPQSTAVVPCSSRLLLLRNIKVITSVIKEIVVDPHPSPTDCQQDTAE